MVEPPHPRALHRRGRGRRESPEAGSEALDARGPGRGGARCSRSAPGRRAGRSARRARRGRPRRGRPGRGHRATARPDPPGRLPRVRGHRAVAHSPAAASGAAPVASLPGYLAAGRAAAADSDCWHSEPIECQWSSTSARPTVLRAIVEEYVQTAQPVASQTIAQLRAPRGLERHGPQRHDPARARGLHRPAPHLGRPDPDRPGLPLLRRPLHRGGLAPAPAQRRAVADFFASAHQALEDLLHETSQLLARLTSHAAVVVGPQFDDGHACAARSSSRSSPSSCSRSRCSRTARSRRKFSNAGDFDDDQIARPSAALDAHARGRRSAARAAARRAHGRPGGRPARAPRRARRSRRRAASGARAALRRWREPDRGRAGRVRHRRARLAPARDARAAGRRRVARARPPRPGRHRQHRLRERRRRAARLLARRSRRTASTGRSPAPSACSARPGWTTSRRSPRWPRCRSSSAGSCSAELTR